MKYLVPFNRSTFSTPLLDEFDKLFNDIAMSMSSGIKASSKNLNPKINAYKKDGKYCIDALAPYATKEDIDVTLEENVLTISIKSHQDKEISDNDYVVREISRGQTTRQISMGEDVDLSSVKTKFENGLLHIEFDAKVAVEETKVKKIAIG